MSKKTDFAVGQQQLFTTTPYSRELQRNKKLKYFINAGTRTKFVLYSWHNYKMIYPCVLEIGSIERM